MKIKKFKTYFSDTSAMAKIYPTIFATMLFNMGYGIVNTVISSIHLSFFIGLTGIYSLIFGITKGYSLKTYNAIQTQKIDNTNNKAENACAKNIAVCGAVMSFLLFSLAFVCLFFYENPANYSFLMIVFISGATVIKIMFAIINSIRTRKNHSRIIYYLKLTDAANALISLGLTQRAILYYVSPESAKTASGIGGIIFSLCALLVCAVMIVKSIMKTKTDKLPKATKTYCHQAEDIKSQEFILCK